MTAFERVIEQLRMAGGRAYIALAEVTGTGRSQRSHFAVYAPRGPVDDFFEVAGSRFTRTTLNRLLERRKIKRPPGVDRESEHRWVAR